MAPPNRPAKSAPKPPAAKGSEPTTTSIFAAMKKEGALAKNMAKAKKVVAVREFDGPDGDYLAVLNRVSHYTKDGALGIVFEFRATDEGETQGQKMVIFTIFKANEYRTIQEIQNEFFEMLQLLGIDTDCDDTQLEVALNKLVESKSEVTLRVKTSKKGTKYTSVVGLASAAKEVAATLYVEEGTTDYVEEGTTDEEAVDEWVDETVEEVEEVVEGSDLTLPSSWKGYAMVYKGVEVEVLDANDETMKCIIKHGNKKLNVPFSVLTPPAE